jgi:hypothetical protein
MNSREKYNSAFPHDRGFNQISSDPDAMPEITDQQRQKKLQEREELIRQVRESLNLRLGD